MDRNQSDYVAHEGLKAAARYRYSVGLLRQPVLSAEGLHERIQLQANNATQALTCAKHVTGAVAVFDAVRLGEVVS